MPVGEGSSAGDASRAVRHQEASAAVSIEQVQLCSVEPQLSFLTLSDPAGRGDARDDPDPGGGLAQIRCAGVLGSSSNCLEGACSDATTKWA